MTDLTTVRIRKDKLPDFNDVKHWLAKRPGSSYTKQEDAMDWLLDLAKREMSKAPKEDELSRPNQARPA